MDRIRVKVCGITRLEDARALDALNVDYLGFNFSRQSKRFIEPAAAAIIISQLRHAVPVGVFVNSPPDQIQEITRETGIRISQLHGDENWDVIDRVSLPVIKAIPHTRLPDYGGLRDEWNKHENHPEYFLVDTQSGAKFGGSGETFDWTLLRSHILPRPFFLAGGLGPENLAEALAATEPFAVDLNSRVESAPGIKDVERVKRCIAIVEKFQAS